MSGRLLTARSFLFVPGTRPERFAKAVAAGPDMVVVDLEDAVASDEKEAARAAMLDWSSSCADLGRVLVRINAIGTPWHDEDLSAILTAGVAGVMLPKAEPGAPLETVSGAGMPVLALIETASGVLDARQVAATAGVVRLALGSFDLATQLGVDPTDAQSLLASRQSLVLASAAEGLAGPVDGVHAVIDDEDGLRGEIEHARRLGFTGKLCIHPRQVVAVAGLLAPTAEDVEWARRILAAPEPGVSSVDGAMVDRPVVERARSILSAAQVMEER